MPRRKPPKIADLQKEIKLYHSTYIEPFLTQDIGQQIPLVRMNLREFFVSVTNEEPSPSFVFPIKKNNFLAAGKARA